MPTRTAPRLRHTIVTWLSVLVARWRARPETGSHATEYAIGIGLSAAIAIALWAAYQNGVQGIIGSWFFGAGGG